MTEFVPTRSDNPETQGSAGRWTAATTMGACEWYGNGNTIDGTPVLAYSVFVPINSVLSVTAQLTANRDDFTQAISGTVLGTFVRDNGNVTRTGAQSKDLVGGLGFTCDLVANTATQTADVMMKGEGTHMNHYHVRVYLY